MVVTWWIVSFLCSVSHHAMLIALKVSENGQLSEVLLLFCFSFPECEHVATAACCLCPGISVDGSIR